MVRVWVAGKSCYKGPYLSALEMYHDKALYKLTLLILMLCVRLASGGVCTRVAYS